MKIKDYLTIVIPCKNEENYISKLLTSLCHQEKIFGTKVIIADAESTDNTIKEINKFSNCDWLDIEVVPGGLPAVGRNVGAKLSITPYVLFIDADMILENRYLIFDALKDMIQGNRDMVTCKIRTNSKSVRAKLYYKLTSLTQMLSSFINKPLSIGMFMMVKRQSFLSLEGFNEECRFAEDYHLSRQIDIEKFSVVNNYIVATDRRFKKMGYLKPGFLALKIALNPDNLNSYKEDLGYWTYKF